MSKADRDAGKLEEIQEVIDDFNEDKGDPMEVLNSIERIVNRAIGD